MDLVLFKHVRRAAWVSIAASGAWIGWTAIHRSLWLDEAWVANSLRGSLQEMFWTGEWLQTTPPLFLLIARAAVAVFGLSTETLRAIPLIFALLAATALAGATKRMAPLAVAALLFPTIAVEYFTSFKQYGAEAAAAALVLWATVEYRRIGFVPYLAGVVLLLTLAYPLAFLLPGLVLFLWREEGAARAAAFAAGCGAVLGLLYFFFIRPNVEPSLWNYWGAGIPASRLWIAAVVALAGWAAWKRRSIEFACLLACLLLLAGEWTGWYPASPRTRLFVWPCFIFAAVMFAEEFVPWTWVPPVAAIVLAVTGTTRTTGPLEDYPAAIAFLRQNVAPEDLLVAHPNAREGLMLYGPDLPVHYGSTGWPCCMRGRTPQRSSEAAVRADLASLIPPGFRGRVWLFYSNRPFHWEYIGLDEGELWRRLLWERGCPPGEYIVHPNLAINEMRCGPQE